MIQKTELAYEKEVLKTIQIDLANLQHLPDVVSQKIKQKQHKNQNLYYAPEVRKKLPRLSYNVRKIRVQAWQKGKLVLQLGIQSGAYIGCSLPLKGLTPQWIYHTLLKKKWPTSKDDELKIALYCLYHQMPDQCRQHCHDAQSDANGACINKILQKSAWLRDF